MAWLQPAFCPFRKRVRYFSAIRRAAMSWRRWKYRAVLLLYVVQMYVEVACRRWVVKVSIALLALCSKYNFCFFCGSRHGLLKYFSLSVGAMFNFVSREYRKEGVFSRVPLYPLDRIMQHGRLVPWAAPTAHVHQLPAMQWPPAPWGQQLLLESPFSGGCVEEVPPVKCLPVNLFL